MKDTEAFPEINLVIIVSLLYNFDLLVSLPNRASCDLLHSRNCKV
jgi:hypothetical protein